MGKDFQGGRNNNSEDTTTPFAKSVCEDCRNATPVRRLLESNLGFVQAFIIRMSHSASANQLSRHLQVKTVSFNSDRNLKNEVCASGDRQTDRQTERQRYCVLNKASSCENEWKRKGE